MAINFLDNVQINQNQLLGARLQVETADTNITGPLSGQIIYNSTTNVFKYYNGTNWIDPSAGTYTGWTLTGDSGTTANITSGAAVVFVGGAGITTTSNGFNLSIGLDLATATSKGGIELFSDTVQTVAGNSVSATASRTYGVQFNSAKQAVVNVPWTDNSSAVEFTFIASSGSDSTVISGGSVTFAQGSGITTTNDGSGTITIAATNAGTMSSFTLAGDSGSSQTISDGDTASIAGGTLISTVAGATDKVNINHDSVTRSNTTAASTLTFGGTFTAIDSVTSTAQGHITAGNTRTFTMPAAPADTTYNFNATAPAANVFVLNLDDQGTGTDSSVTFITSDNNVALARTSATQVSVGLRDDITLVGDLTVGGGDITLSGTGRIQGVDTVSAATDAASKAYVDSVVVGNLVFQGGYNAATNTPDLDSSPSSSIKKGWAYVVTAAGDFFTERVEIGDFLFAQDDSPTALSDWVTVQNNVGVATVSNVGIGNVNIDGAGLKDGLSLAYSAGTATVGLDISSLPASGDVSTLDPTNVYFAVEDEDATANQKITLAQVQQGISPSAVASLTAVSTVVTHNLGTRDVIVQLYDTVTYDTVYADVSRTSTNTITVAFASTPTNTIKCMIYSTEIQGI